MFRLPATPLGIIAELVATLVLSFLIISTLEFLIHKHLMHRRRFPKGWYKAVPYLQLIFFDHAVRHHHRYYNEFDHEPDPEAKLHGLYIENRETGIMIGIAALCLAPVFVFVSPIFVVSFLFVGIVHNKAWNLVHDQMHIPEHNAWFRDAALYRFLARHHFMHHVNTRKNFNVVFPCVDFLVGTVARPALKDVREMVRMGYLHPRTERGRAALAALTARVAARRAQQPDLAPETAALDAAA